MFLKLDIFKNNKVVFYQLYFLNIIEFNIFNEEKIN